MNTTATVETLTAEVRVLMVGNRQVTMSVFNQLDTVDVYAIEPFGRVRPRSAEENEVHVVGKERDTGVLSRSELRQPVGRVSIPDRAIKRVANKYVSPVLIPEPLVVGVIGSDLDWRSIDKGLAPGEIEFADGYEQRVMEAALLAAEKNGRVHRLFQSWCSLPLIVLAGLR